MTQSPNQRDREECSDCNNGRMHLRIDRESHIATLTIDNPRRRNALSEEMMRIGAELIAEAQSNKTRVLVVRGEGQKVFSSGYDLNQLRHSLEKYGDQGVEAIDHPLNILLDALEQFEGITIAQLNGDVIGAGALIALACDLRYGMEGTKWVIPAARFGVVYPARGVRALAALAGYGRALELLVTGLPVLSDEAAAWSLINRLYSPGTLSLQVERTAATIAANAPLAVKAAKTAARAHGFAPLDPSVRHLLEGLTSQALVSRDLEEGMSALRSKRDPQFTGE